MVTADLFLFDDEGRCFAGLTKVTFRRVGRESLLGAAAQQDYRNWLYRLEWQTKESEYYDAQLEPGKWLIVSGDTGLAETLRAILESQDQRAVCVSADDEISFGSTDELPLRGVIYLSGDLSGSCRMGHRLVQAISQQRLSLAPRLCFVTRGTQAAGSRPVSSVAGAPLWGLANVLAAEHPELRTVTIDLDSEPDLNEARSIIEEILTEDGETRIAFRKGLRYVERPGPRPASERNARASHVPRRLHLSDHRRSGSDWA